MANSEVPAPPYTRDANDVARALGTDVERGLTAEEAARRLAEHGRNVLHASPPRSAWQRLLAQFHDPLVILLLVAAVIALTAWLVEGSGGWPVDAIVIAVVVSLNAALGYVQESKAESAVAALARVTEVTSGVFRDGRLQRVPSAALVAGDVLVLTEGDSVGADARLISAKEL